MEAIISNRRTIGIFFVLNVGNNILQPVYHGNVELLTSSLTFYLYYRFQFHFVTLCGLQKGNNVS